MKMPGGLARTLLGAQIAVIVVAAVTLAGVAALITPSLFTHHLELAGETDDAVQHHALQALASTVAVAGALAVAAALLAASVTSWILVSRIARPLDDLASAAQAIQRGQFPPPVTPGTTQGEVAQVVTSFNEMASRLEQTDASRLRLLADLSHELRTPLATLEAYIDGIEDGVVAESPDTFTTMRAQVARMRRLTSDLAVVTAAGEHALDLHPEPINVQELLDAARASAAPRYEGKGVHLTVATPAPSFIVTCDEARMQQVLANLLENSLRHTPAGGTVTLTARSDGTSGVIEVGDTGEGIPADGLQVIFERFTRLDPSRTSTDGSGSGLGLSIARDIIRGHGGELTATSDGIGRGTTMLIRLPLHLEGSRQLPAAP